MNKQYVRFVILLMLPIIVQANLRENPNSLKIRAAAFIPTSKLFREIYQTVGPCIELEYAYRFRDYLEGWGNFDWFFKHGRSVGLNNPTKVKVANFSFGLKFPYNIKQCHEVYIGTGPSISGIWLTNKSCCGCEKVSKPAGGIIVKSGYYYNFSKHLFLDFFADYLYQPIHFQHRVDIGGLKMGIGFGGKF